ncbi:Protein SHQ1-like protein, partial [Armadillidium nasatum]
FKLSQTESEVSVTIYAPFARLTDTEINIDENIFIFYSSPYYLRLNLPGKLIDSEKEVHKASYDADQGSYLVTCMKQTFGEFFPGLDMLTDLLTPKGASNVKQPIMEVLSGDFVSNERDDDDELEFFIEQKLPEENTSEGFKYGFANMYNNVFSSLTSELSCLVDIKDPDNKPGCERRKERLQVEEESFDEDHYLADLYDQDVILPSLHFEPMFYKLKKEEVEYSSQDEETLLKLPRKELLIDKGCKSQVFYGLVDIIFSWCYDHRVTVGEKCSESAWNIRKLSAQLSWLNTFSNLKEVVVSSVRRSLIFPLMRNFEMSLLVLQDTIQILSLGRKQVLKCLLEIHSMFNNYEPYYILNQLYITDYCVWIQTIKEEKLKKLTDALKQVSIAKEELGLELPDLENAANMVLQEEKDSQNKDEENLNNIVESLGRVSVIENAFAVSGNDNETEEGLLLPPSSNIICNNSTSIHQEDVDSDDDSSDEDSSDDSDDDDSDDDSSDDSDNEDDDDDSSSTSSASLDSVADSENEGNLILKNETH